MPRKFSRKGYRYKTEFCHRIKELGECKYGEVCQFAHSPDEIRSILRHIKYKTVLCRSYHEEGHCSYGERCNFIHEPDSSSSSDNFSNFDLSSPTSLSGDGLSFASFRRRDYSTSSEDSFSSIFSGSSSSSLQFNMSPTGFSDTSESFTTNGVEYKIRNSQLQEDRFNFGTTRQSDDLPKLVSPTSTFPKSPAAIGPYRNACSYSTQEDQLNIGPLETFLGDHELFELVSSISKLSMTSDSVFEDTGLPSRANNNLLMEASTPGSRFIPLMTSTYLSRPPHVFPSPAQSISSPTEPVMQTKLNQDWFSAKNQSLWSPIEPVMQAKLDQDRFNIKDRSPWSTAVADVIQPPFDDHKWLLSMSKTGLPPLNQLFELSIDIN